MLKKIPTLFQKIEESKVETKTDEPKKEETQEKEQYIKIDDVIKVDLRVGTITIAESVPDSEKLIKLQVDFGDLGTKQIFAGVRKWYHPEDLIGKQGIFVCNLKPRKMMGQESQGMMLLAEGSDGKLHLVNPEGLVSNGTRLR